MIIIILNNTHYNELQTGLVWNESLPKSGIMRPGCRIGSLTESGRSVKWMGKRIQESYIIWYKEYGYLPRNLKHLDGDIENNSVLNLLQCVDVENILRARERGREKAREKKKLRVNKP